MKPSGLLAAVLVGAAISCCEEQKDVPNPVKTTTGPGEGEVDAVLHGLIAFVPLGSTKADGMKSVFLNPAMEAHVPFVGIETGAVHKSNTSVPDHLVGGESGDGLALWGFTEFALDGNVAEDPIDYNADKLVDDEPDFEKLRWVPHLDDITGTPEPYDPNEVAKAAATADWKHGRLTPVFDIEAHQTEAWTIGERKSRPLADAVRIRLKLKDAAQPAVLRIKRNGTWEDIPIAGGTTLQFSAYPKMIPKPGDDLLHFHHFYQLRTVTKDGPPPKKIPPPTPNPARCAPFIVLS